MASYETILYYYTEEWFRFEKKTLEKAWGGGQSESLDLHSCVKLELSCNFEWFYMELLNECINTEGFSEYFTY